jgi:hypothetical protein
MDAPPSADIGLSQQASAEVLIARLSASAGRVLAPCVAARERRRDRRARVGDRRPTTAPGKRPARTTIPCATP